MLKTVLLADSWTPGLCFVDYLKIMDCKKMRNEEYDYSPFFESLQANAPLFLGKENMGNCLQRWKW